MEKEAKKAALMELFKKRFGFTEFNDLCLDELHRPIDIWKYLQLWLCSDLFIRNKNQKNAFVIIFSELMNCFAVDTKLESTLPLHDIFKILKRNKIRKILIKIVV